MIVGKLAHDNKKNAFLNKFSNICDTDSEMVRFMSGLLISANFSFPVFQILAP